MSAKKYIFGFKDNPCVCAKQKMHKTSKHCRVELHEAGNLICLK